MHIVSVVGARPNFVKIAPIARALAAREGVRHTIIHTGQHYDRAMSNSFFDVLGIPEAEINLNVGSGKHGEQTGKIMIAIEPVLEELRPDWIIVVGDVNSTVATALVATKIGIPLAHVEAGLRSNDRGMPEEVNRVATDVLSSALFVTEQSGLDNLKHEGIDDSLVHFTGNVMIDSLVYIQPKLESTAAWTQFELDPGEYVVVTLHRPSNVDNEESLADLVGALKTIAEQSPILFPVHPRTRANLEKFGLWDSLEASPGIKLEQPLDYLTFLSLVSRAKALLTDSGGIQEETTFLGVPCLTLRPNTERPSTIELGTNELIKPVSGEILTAWERIAKGEWKSGTVPPLWDGKAAERIVKVLLESAR